MNSIVAKQYLWPTCVIKKDFETGLHCSQFWASRHAKRISPPY